MRRSLNLLLVLAFLIALVGGCFDSEDSPIDPDPAVSTYPFPDTAEQLMANVRAAFEDMDITEYAFTLHEDFEFVFSPECLIAPADDTYSREEDLLHTTRLLDGETGYDQVNQRVLPAVSDIAFLQFENLTGWSEVSIDEPGYPGGAEGDVCRDCGYDAGYCGRQYVWDRLAATVLRQDGDDFGYGWRGAAAVLSDRAAGSRKRLAADWAANSHMALCPRQSLTS